MILFMSLSALIESEGDVTKFYKYVALGKCPNLSKVKISSLLRQDFLLFCCALKSCFREKKNLKRQYILLNPKQLSQSLKRCIPNF